MADVGLCDAMKYETVRLDVQVYSWHVFLLLFKTKPRMDTAVHCRPAGCCQTPKNCAALFEVSQY